MNSIRKSVAAAVLMFSNFTEAKYGFCLIATITIFTSTINRFPNPFCCKLYPALPLNHLKLGGKNHCKPHHAFSLSKALKNASSDNIAEGSAFIAASRFLVSFCCQPATGASTISMASTCFKSSIIADAYSFFILMV